MSYSLLTKARISRAAYWHAKKSQSSRLGKLKKEYEEDQRTLAMATQYLLQHSSKKEYPFFDYVTYFDLIKKAFFHELSD